MSDKDFYELTISDLEGLPPEVLSELSTFHGSAAKKEEMIIASFMKSTMSIDHILISYWKETGKILKRDRMNQRLYRMVLKGILETVPRKKGVYRLTTKGMSNTNNKVE